VSVDGQQRHRRRDGGLHVDDGAVDVAAKVERQRDLAAAAPLLDVISSTPAIVVNWRSSGLATVDAIVAGVSAGEIGLDVDRRVVDGRADR
jgi:hypothetical protein